MAACHLLHGHFEAGVELVCVLGVEALVAFKASGSVITRNSSRDILKWAFAARILCPFQTTAHAGVLRYAPSLNVIKMALKKLQRHRNYHLGQVVIDAIFKWSN